VTLAILTPSGQRMGTVTCQTPADDTRIAVAPISALKQKCDVKGEPTKATLTVESPTAHWLKDNDYQGVPPIWQCWPEDAECKTRLTPTGPSVPAPPAGCCDVLGNAAPCKGNCWKPDSVREANLAHCPQVCR
jgi:hypothetical protein